MPLTDFLQQSTFECDFFFTPFYQNDVYTVDPTQLSLQELVCVLDANSWHTWWKNCFWQIDHRPLIKLDKWCIKRLLQIPDQKHPCFDNRNRVFGKQQSHWYSAWLFCQEWLLQFQIGAQFWSWILWCIFSAMILIEEGNIILFFPLKWFIVQMLASALQNHAFCSTVHFQNVTKH